MVVGLAADGDVSLPDLDLGDGPLVLVVGLRGRRALAPGRRDLRPAGVDPDGRAAGVPQRRRRRERRAVRRVAGPRLTDASRSSWASLTVEFGTWHRLGRAQLNVREAQLDWLDGAVPTTVDRLLPTEEAEALLELTRELAAKELAPQVHDAEEKGEFPAAAYALLGKSGLLSLPFAEEDGGGGQPYEVYLQVVEEIAAVWPSVAVGLSVHTLTASVVAANATPGAARDLAAADARRRVARRLLPLRAAGRLRRQRHPDPRSARRRRVRRLRHQAVDQQRLVRRLLHPLRPHRRAPDARAERVRRAGRHGRHELRRAGEEDGAGLRRDHPGALRRGADPGRPAHRRRGRRHEGGALRPRRRPAGHRRRRHRHRPGRDGARRRIRPGAPAVRPARSASSRVCSSCSPSSAPRSSGPGRRTSTPPGSRTPAAASPARPASPS